MNSAPRRLRYYVAVVRGFVALATAALGCGAAAATGCR